MTKPYIVPDLSNPIVLFTAALVLTVTLGVGATGWTAGLGIITFIGLGTVVISFMLVRSGLPSFLAHPMSLIIGLGWSFWVTSRLLPIHYTWWERWDNLAQRLASWYIQASEGGTSYDNLMFIFQMNIIVWSMGYMTIWLILHSGRVWQAILPGGLVIIINLYYAPLDITFWFIIYLMLSLLLVLRFNLSQQEARWRSEGTLFRPDISFDVLRDGFIFAVMVMILAWLMPPIASAKSLGMFDNFQGSWQDIQREWNRLYANLNYRNVSGLDTFGTSITLGGPRTLTNEPIMDVKVEGVGGYWRAAVYDEYSGAGWLTNDDFSATFSPDTSLALPTYQARHIVTQTYTYYRDGATVLYALNSPIKLDRSAKATYNALPDDLVLPRKTAPLWSADSGPWVEEITYMRSDALVDKGESYQVVSAVTQATLEELTASGDDYPVWVMARYLQLPDTVTERTRELARSVTAPFDNNYAKAHAIELYLRNAIKYNEKIAQPPDGVDKVDYIIFEAKEAYCDYYASAMIVMLRSVGIPARFVAGYAKGSYDATTQAYHVVNADAHSWVEVYFPQYGWIEFEPTAAQPMITRASSAENSGPAASSAAPQELPDPLDRPERPENMPIDVEAAGASSSFNFRLPWFNQQVTISQSFLIGGSIIISLTVLLSLASGLLWWQIQSSYGNPTESIFKLYQRLQYFAHWTGVARPPWQTPHEHAALLQQQFPMLQPEVDIITTEYVEQAFRPMLIQPNTVAFIASADSQAAWQRLRPEMQKAIIRRYLPQWLMKFYNTLTPALSQKEREQNFPPTGGD